MNTDTLYSNIAGVLVGDSFNIPSHIAFSSTVVTLDPTSSTLTGEFGSRVATTPSRELNVATYSAIRSGAVASSTGDRINSIGLFSSSTGGELYSIVLVPSLLHTTSFDFEIDWSEEVTN